MSGHRFENQPPVLGAVDITRAQQAALQVAEVVEAKERVIADNVFNLAIVVLS